MKDSCTAVRKGRGGFTLVELCIVIALLAIVTTMTVSFSLLMDRDTKKNQAKYDFMEEVTRIREEAVKCISVYDINVNDEITASGNGVYKNSNIETLEPIAFFDQNRSTFTFISDGTPSVLTLDTVKYVDFACVNEKLIKCTVTGADAYGESFTQTFMIALRCATCLTVGEGS